MIDHPLRHILNDELHGRPGLPVTSPARITHLAFTLDGSTRDPLEHVTQLCNALGIRAPAKGAQHHGVELEGGLFKYERHGEFYRLSISASGKAMHGEAISRLPVSWVDELPGQRLVGIHTHIFGRSSAMPNAKQLLAFFGHEEVACSSVHQGASTVWSDFRIGGDGFSRMLIHERGISPHRLGRLTRRLHEIETYRMMALLALPLARQLQTPLGELEASLSTVVESIAGGHGENRDDAALLQQLSLVARDVERLSNQSSYRFAAAQAYAALVGKRIMELDEERVKNYQRLGVFLDRRFSPAMTTCNAVAKRIDSLAQRCERASNLLRTRVDIALEGQNQLLLRSMERRARQQLMLQETVEGLSVVAISYYGIGIVDKLLEGLAAYLPSAGSKPAQLVVIPLVVFLVWLGVRRLRRCINGAAQAQSV